MATNFGREVSCMTEMRTGRFATGTRLVAESIFRRLTTPRGMLRGTEEEGNFGLDLTELIGSVSTKSDAASLPARIQAEILKDERVESVTVRVVDESAGVAKFFTVFIEATTAEGPFSLTLGIDEVTVGVLGIEAAA